MTTPCWPVVLLACWPEIPPLTLPVEPGAGVPGLGDVGRLSPLLMFLLVVGALLRALLTAAEFLEGPVDLVVFGLGAGLDAALTACFWTLILLFLPLNVICFLLTPSSRSFFASLRVILLSFLAAFKARRFLLFLAIS